MYCDKIDVLPLACELNACIRCQYVLMILLRTFANGCAHANREKPPLHMLRRLELANSVEVYVKCE
jgi:hypothetical protein